MPSGIIVEGDGRIDVPSTSYCWLTNVCDALTAFNASAREQVLQRGFDGAYSATYVYGVPASETYVSDSVSSSLIITLGMGWKLDSGVFASQLMGVGSVTGQVMWNVTGTGALYGDVVPSTNAAQIYAIYGNSLNRIDAGTGAVTSSLQLWYGAPSAAFGREITLSSDSSMAVIYDSNMGVLTGVRLYQSSSMNQAWQSNRIASTNAAKPAYDATTGNVIVGNESTVFAMAMETGSMPWKTILPDDLTIGGARLSVAVDVNGSTGNAYVLGSLSDVSQPVLYALNKRSGAVVARSVLDANYSVWGNPSPMVLDASGTRLYFPLLGPHTVSTSTDAAAIRLRGGAHAGAHAEAADHSRSLQAPVGGSVYVALVTFDTATNAFADAVITALPDALQAGVPVLGLGPADGQLTVASSNAVGVLGSA